MMETNVNENGVHLRSKFKGEKNKEENKVNEKIENNSKNKVKRIAIIHVNGIGDPDETQRISPQVQAYIKAFSNIPNTLIDIYPDNEAKFNLPYQLMAPFPVEITDHLYWSEDTLESFANDLWKHWMNNKELFPSLIITIGPGAVYVSNILFERNFWKIPWIYQGHWDIPKIDRMINPDYYRIEDYAFSAADIILYNSIKQRERALILREQAMSEKHIVVHELAEILYDLQMESDESSAKNEKEGNISRNEYYGISTTIKNKKERDQANTIISDILQDGSSTMKKNNEEEKKSNSNSNSNSHHHSNDDNNNEEKGEEKKEEEGEESMSFTTSSKLKAKKYVERNENVVDEDYKNLTSEQKYEWNKKYGIDEEELLGKKRDAYDTFIDKYTNFLNKCSKYQREKFNSKQSRPCYVFSTLNDVLKYQERKQKFAMVTLFFPLILLCLLIRNISWKYEIPSGLFLILISAYLVYIIVKRQFITPKPIGKQENIIFAGKVIAIIIGIIFRNNIDIRSIGTGSLLLLVDGIWDGIKTCLLYELNLKWTVVKLIHVMFIRLVIFPLWFFVSLIDRYQIPYFIYFGIMYIANWNKSYKVLEEYLFLVE